MKTKILALVALIALHSSEAARKLKSKRGSFEQSYPLRYSGSSHIPVQTAHVDNYLPVHQYSGDDFHLNVELPPPRRIPPSVAPVASVAIISNSLDKPVMEYQEIVPPQSVGNAIIPRMPPPATPVNAVASNVPADRGAVYLGSGSIGVVNLGNGAYALGSGSIGYSGNRARPRPNAMVPVYPPIPATPNLIPAAVPSPAVQPVNPLDFNHPFFNPPTQQIDQNGYEYLPPNQVGFGMPTPQPPTLKIRPNFATPTALQLQQQPQQQPQQFQFQQPQQQQLPSPDFEFGILSHPAGGGFSGLA